MRFNLSLYWKAALWLCAPVVCQLIIFGLYGRLNDTVSTSENQEYQSRTILGETNWIVALATMQKFSCFVYAQSKNPGELKHYEELKAKVERLLPDLARSCAGAQTRQAAQNLSAQWQALSALSDQSNTLAQANQSAKSIELLESDRYQQAWDKLMSARSSLFAQDREDFVAQHAGEVTKDRIARQHIMELCLICNIVFSLLLLLIFSRQIAKRLSIVNDNTVRLATERPLNNPMHENDEIGMVDHAFHQMAGVLREARERERAIIENAVDVICSVDREGVLVAVSRSCAAAWSYEPQQLIGTKLSSHFSGKSRAGVVAAFSAAIDSKSSLSIESEFVRGDNAIVVLHWTGCWSQSEQRLFCIARDVTTQRQLDDMRMQFLAMVSHDLRTPLSSFLVFLDLVRTNAVPTEKLVRLADKTKRSVSTLMDMVNDLLDAEKLEHGTFNLEKEHLQIADLFDEAIDMIQELATQRGIKIACSDAGLSMFADEARIKQVVVNLLSNAIKYSKSGEIIKLTADIVDESVEIAVCDQGKGIPEDQQSLIFERFHQVTPKDGQRGVGTGLGLALCKALVKAHGGTIGVVSKIGEGSRFWFRIPVVAESNVLNVALPQMSHHPNE